MVLAIVLLLRLTIPPLILRRPLFGALLAIAADVIDYNLYSRFGWGVLRGPGISYQLLDKALDTYYMFFALMVANKWTAALRVSSFILFGWRLAGVVLLFLLQNEIVLLIFPNFFETFFLATLFLRLDKRERVHPAWLLFLFATAIIQKLFQEFALHVLPLSYLTIINGKIKSLIQNPSGERG